MVISSLAVMMAIGMLGMLGVKQELKRMDYELKATEAEAMGIRLSD